MPAVSEDKKCEICNNSIRSGGLKCSKCNLTVHKKCFDVISKIFMAEKTNWTCKQCILQNQTESDRSPGSATSEDDPVSRVILLNENECLKREILVLTDLVNELKNVNLLQKEKLEIFASQSVSSSSSDKTKPLFADIVKTPSQINTNSDKQKSAILFVKTNNATESNLNILSEIKTKINPISLNVRIKNTKNIKNGVLINCEDRESLKNLKSSINANMSDRYVATEEKKLNPRLKICSVDIADITEDFVSNFIEQNNLHGNDFENSIKIITKLKYKDNLHNLIIEVSPAVRHQIIQKGFLYIGWRKCFVQDYFKVVRCFKCSKFGHIKKDCKFSTVVCPECSGSHELKDCQAQVKKCINCTNYNFRHKSEISTDHSARDSSCHVYKLFLQQTKSKTEHAC